MTRRILMMGFEPVSRKESPIFDARKRKQFELWTFNNDLEMLKYSRRHFEMHGLEVYAEAAVDDARPDKTYLERLREGLGVPVYHLCKTERIAGSVSYPLKEIVARFGDYLTNTFSFMLALAIHERVDEIHLYGVDMQREHEHGWERPSIEYFLGFARGAGIKVVIPETSDLLKCIGIYGYGGADHNPYELEAIARARRAELAAAQQSFQRQADQLKGALDDIDYWMRRMMLPGDRFRQSATSKKAAGRKKWLMDRRRRFQDAEEQYREALKG